MEEMGERDRDGQLRSNKRERADSFDSRKRERERESSGFGFWRTNGGGYLEETGLWRLAA